jgi:cytoskeletal protein RodZ
LTADERVAAFGRWLLQERELRALPREEVARLTRLAPGVVEALESGDPARMPPRAYLLGYLRAYAGAVGLDADDVVLRWQEAAGDPGGSEPGAGARPPRRPRMVKTWLAAGAALLVAAAVAAGLWSRSSRTLSLPDRSGKPMQRGPYVQP